MKIHIHDGLPYVSATLYFQNQTLSFDRILIDTGSAGTIFSADSVSPMGLKLAPHDPIRTIRGVGGTEFVFVKNIDRLEMGTLQASNVEIEIGAMDYGMPIDGIIGMSFLLDVGTTIDLRNREVY